MRNIGFIIIVSITFLYTNAQQNSSGFRYSISLLEGKWHVAATNFPIWLDAKNTNPDFNYTNFREKNGKLIFDEIVAYSKNKDPKQIKSKNKQKNSKELKFTRRGKGLHRLFKSNWKIIANDKEGRWIVIYSDKTLVSSEGVDIIARKKDLSEKEIKGIISHLDKTYIKKPIEVLK